MSRTGVAITAVALLMLLTGAVGSVSAATPGFAVYKVESTSHGLSYSLTVNETVATTSNPAFDNLILSVVTSGWNSNYSRSINSSSDVSPFLPSISNQTFSYAAESGNVTLGIIKNGTLSVQFQGASYALTSYALNAKSDYNGSSAGLRGAVAAFPSGLVYSVKLNTDYSVPASLGLQYTMNGTLGTGGALAAALPSQGATNVSVTLLSTSLPLKANSPSSTAQVASIGIGAGAAVSALAIGLGVRYRGKHNQAAPDKKPEHWVD